jgi:hypothetical protein
MSKTLTAEQDARAVRALATFKAKREALRAGLPLQQVDADRWIVDVDARDPEVAQERLAQ